MKTECLQLAGALLSTNLSRMKPPTDVAPPPEAVAEMLAPLALVAVIGFGCLCAVITVVCLLRVRATAKSRIPKKDA